MAETGMERVEDAIFRASCTNPSVRDNPHRCLNPCRCRWAAKRAARAAIEALRTPTEVMQAAKDAIDMSEATDAIWPAMIDSLLKEEGQ